jgi:hypothetical protein
MFKSRITANPLIPRTMPNNTRTSSPATVSRTIVPRHPSRYRITFTPPSSRLQTLYLDSVPNLARQPPRPNEIAITLALDHTTACTRTNLPRTLVPCHITTLGVTTPVATTTIKVCMRCLTTTDSISANSPHERYASIPLPVTTTWTKIQIITVPQYYPLPPDPCSKDHNPPCTHTHCSTPNTCTCNAPPPASGDTLSPTQPARCLHHHCPSDANCVCTRASDCEKLSDHVMPLDGPHRLCIAAHCDNPSAHLTPSNEVTPVVTPCPNPAAHNARPSRATPLSLSQACWLMACLRQFSVSDHARSYTITCNQLLDHMIQFHSQVAHLQPVVDLDSPFPPMETHHNRALLLVVYAFHSLDVLKDRDSHVTHECRLLVCPLRVLAQLRSGTNTLSSTSLTSLIALIQSDIEYEMNI